MTDVITAINNVVWSPALVYLCLAVGVFFTIRTRLVQRKVSRRVRQIPSGGLYEGLL